MRSRPIGPGVGGLYYSPLLQDAHKGQHPAARRGLSAGYAPRAQFRRLWTAFAGVVRRAARRLVDARMADAQRYVDQAVRSYQIDPVAGRRGSAVRYY